MLSQESNLGDGQHSRGDVLRCLIHDEDGRRAVIEIDGQ